VRSITPGGPPGSARAAHGGDLANQAVVGHHLPAALVVVVGVQVDHGLGGQEAERLDGVNGRRRQAVIAVVGRGRTTANRMPAPSTATERLRSLVAPVCPAGPGRRRAPW
jgi:hypothetical protein